MIRKHQPVLWSDFLYRYNKSLTTEVMSFNVGSQICTRDEATLRRRCRSFSRGARSKRGLFSSLKGLDSLTKRSKEKRESVSQVLFNLPRTSLQPSYNLPTASKLPTTFPQPPYNLPTTALQTPYNNVHTTALQPPYNHPTTSLQPRLYCHTT